MDLLTPTPLAGRDLTRFGDHDKLIADLTAALRPGSPRAVLAVFELIGRRDEERVTEAEASWRLVARCAEHFAQVIEPVGAYYRPRRDEFCALITGSIDDVRPVLLEAERRLQLEAGSSLVSACFGEAVLPDEAADPHELLMLADQRITMRLGGALRR